MKALWSWFASAANWAGDDGIWNRLGQHLAYSALSLLIAALVAVPLGLWIGHSGRGRVVAVGLVNGARAIPTLGLLFISVLVLAPRISGADAFLVPSILVLVVLAAPPLLAGAYAGVAQVDPAVRDAGLGMGLTRWQLLWQIELPCALPLLFGGLRSAALQVVATATIAATVSVGGLGRFLIDGLAYRDYTMMAGGAILVGALALGVDAVLAGVQRLVVSAGLRSRTT